VPKDAAMSKKRPHAVKITQHETLCYNKISTLSSFYMNQHPDVLQIIRS
jgi:hypothetical protein